MWMNTGTGSRTGSAAKEASKEGSDTYRASDSDCNWDYMVMLRESIHFWVVAAPAG